MVKYLYRVLWFIVLMGFTGWQYKRIGLSLGGYIKIYTELDEVGELIPFLGLFFFIVYVLLPFIFSTYYWIKYPSLKSLLISFLASIYCYGPFGVAGARFSAYLFGGGG